MWKFLKQNFDFFIILGLVYLGSNAHVLLQGFFPEEKMFYVYLTAQQLCGAPVLFTFLYFLSVNKKFVLKKSLSLSLFILSVFSFIGELSDLFDFDFLSQSNKGYFLICEWAFIVTVFIIGVLRFKKDA